MSSKIKFKPFIGKSYQQSDFKILVLGESHYFGEEDLKAFNGGDTSKISSVTQKVVNEYLDFKNGQGSSAPWMSTFTKFSNLFAGESLLDSLLVKLWQSFAFYNYVQVPMGGPRESPTAADFLASEPAFKEVLKDLQPDLVLFWGHRLWNHFPKNAYQQKGDIYILSYDRDYPIFVLPHPSSQPQNTNEKYDELRDYIKKLS